MCLLIGAERTLRIMRVLRWNDKTVSPVISVIYNTSACWATTKVDTVRSVYADISVALSIAKST